MVSVRLFGAVLLAVVATLAAAGTGVGLAASPAPGSSPAEASTAAAAPDGAVEDGAAAEASATYRMEPAGPGEVRVTVAVAVPADAETVTVGFAPSAFRFRSWTAARSGFDGPFERVDGGGNDAATYRVSTDGEDVALSYTVDANVSNVVFDGLDAAATEDWALLPTRLLLPGRIAVDGETLGDDAVATDAGAFGASYVGTGYAFLGAHERRTFTAGDERITVVMPATVERSGFDRIERTVSMAAEELRVGGRSEAVTAFVAPAALRPGGRTVAADFWVNADPRADIAAHEYVHTRQDFEAGDGMRWFVEASAQYYGLRAALATGDLSAEGFRDELTDVDSGGALTSLGRWESLQTPYEKGALVLAALDARIRAVSDGDRTLQYVVTKMNAHDGSVDESEFRTFVAEAAGESQDDWLDRHVDGSATPLLPAEDAAFAFVASGDADDDGLPDREEVVLGTDPKEADTDGDDLADGEDAEPLVPRETVTETTEDRTTTSTGPTPGTATPDRTTVTATPTDASGAGNGGTTSDADGGGAPGPGLLGAAAALVAGVWLAVRRR